MSNMTDLNKIEKASQGELRPFSSPAIEAGTSESDENFIESDYVKKEISTNQPSLSGIPGFTAETTTPTQKGIGFMSDVEDSENPSNIVTRKSEGDPIPSGV